MRGTAPPRADRRAVRSRSDVSHDPIDMAAQRAGTATRQRKSGRTPAIVAATYVASAAWEMRLRGSDSRLGPATPACRRRARAPGAARSVLPPTAVRRSTELLLRRARLSGAGQ